MHLARRLKISAARQRYAKFDEQQKSGDASDATAVRKKVQCFRHDDQHPEFGSKPCVLDASLQKDFPADAVLRLVCRGPSGEDLPDLRLFARAHVDNFSQKCNGISILQPIAESANIGSREVELEVVTEEEAQLDAAVLVVGDRYYSKRDIWLIHSSMMQTGGQLLYSAFLGNLRQQCPDSSVRDLKGPQGQDVRCGLVHQGTALTFRSRSVNIFVLLQVSSELLNYGLAGRPYWDVLREAFAQLVDKCLRTTSTSNGHYIRMVLFVRTLKKCKSEDGNAWTGAADCRGAGESAALETGNGAPSCGVQGDTKAEETTDYYEVFWEGFAKQMPPTGKLAARVHSVCASLHERWVTLERGEPERCTSVWPKLKSNEEVVEASAGNVLECLNIALDEFDYHHLGRMMRVTGQKIVLVTACNGLLRPKSKELYKLTHQRFSMHGPSTIDGFQMVCIRQPPLHRVPWVVWPGGDGPWMGDANTGSDTEGGGEPIPLPSSPPWMKLVFYPEVSFCRCVPTVEYVRSSLLPLESLRLRRCFVPIMCGGELQAGDASSSSARVLSAGAASRSAQRFRPSAAAADLGGAFVTPSRAASKSCRVCGTATLPEGDDDLQRLWDDVREPRLTPYWNRDSPVSQRRGALQTYIVSPEKFGDHNSESEQIEFMNDIVGVRIETLATPQVFWRKLEASPGEHRQGEAAKPVHNPWAAQGSLIPEALHRVLVRSTNGEQWHLEPKENGLEVVHEYETGESAMKREHERMYFYNPFWVRRRIVRFDIPGSQEREALKGNGATKSSGNDADAACGWVKCRRIFHLPESMDFNYADMVIAGIYSMPAALPFPTDTFGGDSQESPTKSKNKSYQKLEEEKHTGWKLRSVIKQHFYALIPKAKAERSHAEHFAAKLRVSEGVEIGEDPFLGSGTTADAGALAVSNSLNHFNAFKAALEELCFGKKKRDGGMQLDIEVGANKFSAFKRKSNTIFVRDMPIMSAFPESRDWFELFYDHKYIPPKLFHLVLQWIVCSSVHLHHFMQRLTKLASDTGFTLVSLPIMQLFPQPVPGWVWSHDRETNFDRPAFYPRQRIRMPTNLSQQARRQLNARLLEAWLQLDLFFVLSSKEDDFPVLVRNQGLDGKEPMQNMDTASRMLDTFYQRTKGWVLIDKQGLCLVSLREKHIFIYENGHVIADCTNKDDHDQRLLKVQKLMRDIKTASMLLLQEVAIVAAAAENKLPSEATTRIVTFTLGLERGLTEQPLAETAAT